MYAQTDNKLEYRVHYMSKGMSLLSFHSESSKNWKTQKRRIELKKDKKRQTLIWMKYIGTILTSSQ